MKTVTLSLLVLLLLLGQGEALRCNCGGLKICSGREETCRNLNDICASVVIYGAAVPNFSKGCMSLSECSALNKPGVSTAFCCSQDLCNK